MSLASSARPDDDDKPDFLVNEVVDPDSMPDTIYLSEGEVEPVLSMVNGVTDGVVSPNDLQVQLTAEAPTGWGYLRMPDPGIGYRLARVVRSDGREIPVGENAWTTDRSFPSSESGAIRENLLHLFDFEGTGHYTLHYRTDDSIAPEILRFGEELAGAQDGAVNAVDIEFSEPINLETFDGNDLELRRNGVRLTTLGPVTVAWLSGGAYRIEGLAAATLPDGNYELRVRGAGILDAGGNAAVNDLAVFWAKGTSSPVVIQISEVVPDPRREVVASLEVLFSRPIDPASFGLSALSLRRGSGPDLIDEDVTIAQLTPTSFRIGELDRLTQADGEYTLEVSAASIRGTDGRLGTGALSRGWFTDSAGPTISSLETVTTNPRNTVVQSLDVVFSETVDPASFGLEDLRLTRDGGADLISPAVSITPLSGSRFRIANFNWVVGLEGHYELSVDAAGVQDAAGNQGSGTATSAWTMDLTPPEAPTGIVVQPDTGISAADGLLNT
ncbi:MAG: hypothetical protein KDM81_10190, partial [Verrucomicrobiae bacterium]|nr:hypothetical protein [Verrucomicrobiae bacterium]